MTMKNKPKVGEFYVLSSDVRGGGPGHGVVFENEKELRPAGRESFALAAADFRL